MRILALFLALLAAPALVPLALAAPAAAGESFTGRVVGVADGDTLTVEDAAKKRLRIRLAGIDAPEMDQIYGKSARSALIRLCLGKPAEVKLGAPDGDRSVGEVSCGGRDAAAEQVKRGMAWVSARYTPPGSPLFELEANARLTRAGLWGGKAEPVAPWQWREKEKKP
jgi:endonuclease YncB( thermonuclease family)